MASRRQTRLALRVKPLVFFLAVSLAVATAQQTLLQPLQLSADQLANCFSLGGLTTNAEVLATSGNLTLPRPVAASDVAAAAQLWIWGYPLINMGKAAVTTGTNHDAINRIQNIPALITADNQGAFDIVAPNSDTLYTTYWLDLTAGKYTARSAHLSIRCTALAGPAAVWQPLLIS